VGSYSVSGEAALLYISLEEILRKSGAQDMLIGSASGAASGEFAVNHNGGNTSDAVLLRFGSHFGFLHIVDHYFVRRRPGEALNYLDCFLAR
jgi:hypothetical protein